MNSRLGFGPEPPQNVPHDFSIQSISSAYFVANLILAAIMVYARVTRRVYPGFNDWMGSQLALAGGVVLLSGVAYLSPWISLVAGNSLLMLAQVLVYTGCIRFFELSRHRRWPYYGLLAVTIGSFVWLVGTGASPSWRSLAFSLFTAVMMARTVVALVAQKRLRWDLSVLPLLAAATISMAFFAARAVVLWYVGAEGVLLNQQLLAASFYVGIVFSTLLVFSFLQLVQARTEGELQAAQAQAEELANVDRLTGVWNRRRFENEAEREMAKAARHEQPLSLIAFDIDHFKPINDRYGHQAGDEVLIGICEVARHRIRSTDALIRWGGDEFLIMAPMTAAADAKMLADALSADMALRDFGRAGKVTLSMGVAQYHPLESLETWLARADRGIYAAKAQGRAQVVVEVATPAESVPPR